MKNKLINIILLIISGLLTGLPFSYPNLYFISWFSLVPLLLVIKDQTPRMAFRSGVLSGIFFFGTAIYWIVYPQLIFDLSLTFAVIVTIFLSIMLSILIGTFALISNYLIKHYQNFILFLIPATWMIIEYLTRTIDSSFSFGIIGYTQAYFPILIQIADITGVYGVTFLIILINVLIYKIILHFKYNKILNKLEVITVSLLLIFVFSYGLINLNFPTNEARRSLKLGLMQPNISQEIKWDHQHRTNIINWYVRLTDQLIEDNDLDLVIWPETAIPFVLSPDNMNWQKYLLRRINKFNVSLFTGALNKINDNVYNQAILINQQIKMTDNYSKLSLVPFGEYIPFRNLLPAFVGELVNDKTSGEKEKYFKLKGVTWSSPICSEILNASLVSELASNSQFLINISNEAWFHQSNAPIQIWQAAIFRAVENRRPVIKVSNTGVSGIINKKGKVIKKMSPFQPDTLIYELKLARNNEITIYNKYNYYFPYLVILVILFILLKRNESLF
ncbi:apolipoprotein N-acyltransferase [Selenihalanaerobacter shriftii]|uniref:Apolipoprotein N-acyltransferase n=1 Tax=Selenihalanaerobacter shriftii TaxID=142842 RepID=A0A1T4LZ35_9FIRM|nr:apolipoprotein N-acyltransferase [Selenihalanaerobacter shriftii]SJZ59916.1 apolipoprotein N-acyltransferase [Selenihalanaerobacter shriftii]